MEAEAQEDPAEVRAEKKVQEGPQMEAARIQGILLALAEVPWFSML